MKNLLRLLRYDWPMHLALLLTNWLPDNVIFLRFRGSLCKPFFGGCCKNLRLGRGITFYNCSNIYLGSNIYIAQGNWFSAGEKIHIGNEVIFGPKCVITSSNHVLEADSYRYGNPVRKPIHISDGCWIAANCTITAGTEIGNGTLIAANTVTRGVIPSKVTYGSPKAEIIIKI